jgi:hypothetical protein
LVLDLKVVDFLRLKNKELYRLQEKKERLLKGLWSLAAGC